MLECRNLHVLVHLPYKYTWIPCGCATIATAWARWRHLRACGESEFGFVRLLDGSYGSRGRPTTIPSRPFSAAICTSSLANRPLLVGLLCTTCAHARQAVAQGFMQDNSVISILISYGAIHECKRSCCSTTSVFGMRRDLRNCWLVHTFHASHVPLIPTANPVHLAP